jgi:hypothetical protein
MTIPVRAVAYHLAAAYRTSPEDAEAAHRRIDVRG